MPKILGRFNPAILIGFRDEPTISRLLLLSRRMLWSFNFAESQACSILLRRVSRGSRQLSIN